MTDDYDQLTFAEAFDSALIDSDTTVPRLSRQTGISRRTLENWRYGRTLRPRHAAPLLKVAAALNLDRDAADRLLRAADFPALADLNAGKDDEIALLLKHWTTRRAPNMLPPSPAAQFVGRERLLQRIKKLLRPGSRLAIWGMGGVGKSTLAIAAARARGDTFRDGVFWGDLRASTPEAVLAAWGRTLGLDLSRMADFQSRAAYMRGVFSTRQALIILDDALDGRIALQMLPALPSNCAAIITTRSLDAAELVTRGDQTLQIALQPLNRRESRDLLAGTLGEAALQAELPAADEIAQLVGDLPLALQITAALSRDAGLSLADLAQHLRDLSSRLDRLNEGQEPRVRLVFEQTWQVLDADRRAALAALGVFAGRPFSLPAFAAVAALDELPARLTLSRLQRLSLLTAVSPTAYQQHTLLAAYAGEKLGDDRGPKQRFAAHYLRLLQESADPTADFNARPDNIMAAMRAAYDLAEWERVLAYHDILQPIWRAQGGYSLTREASRWALAAAQALRNQTAESEILYTWGVASLEQSSYDEAEQKLRDALQQFEPLRAFERSGDAYYYLSRNALAQGDFAGANEAVQQAWRSYQKAEDVRGMGRALHRMGHIHFDQGQYEQTLALVDEAISAQRAAGDSKGQFLSAMLGVVAGIQQGDLARARAYCDMAETLLADIDDAVETAVFYYTSADLSRHMGDFQRAHDVGHEALERFRTMHDLRSMANCYNLLAGNEAYWNEAEPQRRRFEEGLAYCRQGLALCDVIQYTLGRGMLHMFEGRLLAQSGDLKSACAAWDASQEAALALDNGWLQQRLADWRKEYSCP